MSLFAVAAGSLLLFSAWVLVGRIGAGVIRPMAVLLVVTGATLLVNGLGLLRIHPVSAVAALAVLILTGATVGAFVTVLAARARPGVVSRLGARWPAPVSRRSARWTGVALSVLTLIGVIAFRMSIADAAGRPYSTLSLSEIRYYQVYDAGSLSLSTSLLLLGPLAAVVNFLCWRSFRARLVGLVVPLGLTFLTPSRTVAMNSLVVVVAFVVVLATKRRIDGLPRLEASRRTMAVVGALGAIGVALLLVGNFLVVGAGLNKLPNNLGISSLPPPIENLLLYTVAPWSAFSDALAGAPGAPGSDGISRVFWVFTKAASVLHLVPPTSASPASYVAIPVPFNTFTWLGDILFSVGTVGAIVCCLAMGAMFGLVDRFMRMQPPVWMVWVNAVLVAVALNAFSGLRLFVLDTVVLLLVGGVVLALVEPARREGVTA
jgi:hypothetical protein